jgi:hypothetical protein
MIFAMVKIDGHETLCIGGKIVMDDEKPGFLWITNLQGEKLLNVDARNYCAITEAEAKEHLQRAHSRREASGESVEIVVVKPEKHKPAAWPEPPRNIHNN